ncbi:FadR/GntR family transcriptional regulator [Allopontixanthobacter sediminis]|uniref:FCD domain-containing protein n=1 Tax=Allopontixanthobacter sediminis TaxID=1689985 RepID=A0A845B3E7_9SPHN|nr:FadR/GntR family transcriptional regulator [Allopontixanthobacter sediminis]MXP44102.1 FCD domain-containing protein [Allopontixanthobacter sediminis]
MGTSLDGRKLYEQVAAAMIAEIRDRTFPVGAKLPSERDLAERFQVSRPTVREAMLALELRGLVEPRRGSGIFVVEPQQSPAESTDFDIGAFELTEARALFEGEAAALAASLITGDELARLDSILEEMIGQNVDNAGDESADREFHVTIARATRNAAILHVVESLWDVRYNSPLCRHMLDRARKHGIKPQIEEHTRILDALRRGNPADARIAMRDHLGRVINGLLEVTETETLERAHSEIKTQRERYGLR